MDSSRPTSNLVLRDKIRAIHALFGSDERLLQFLFHHKMAELRAEPIELIEQARAFSHGEFLLVQVAIDLWCDQGGSRLSELLSTLDDSILMRLMRAIAIMRGWLEVEEALECCGW